MLQISTRNHMVRFFEIIVAELVCTRTENVIDIYLKFDENEKKSFNAVQCNDRIGL